MVYDIIIVGGGPAGLTAAIYGARANKSVLVLEKDIFGGQITNSAMVENFPTQKHIRGVDFGYALKEQARGLGATLRYETVLEVGRPEAIEVDLGEPIDTEVPLWVARCDGGNVYMGRTVIMAIGTTPRTIDLDHDVPVHYCAICDGAFFKGKDVVVVGGANTAVQDAIYLSSICDTVNIVYRGPRLRAESKLVARLADYPNVFVHCNVTVESVIVYEGALSGVRLSNGKLLHAEGFFAAIGNVPNRDPLQLSAPKDDDGYYNAESLTLEPGLYVAGDCRSKKRRQLTTAVSDGTIAAMEAIDYLNN